MKDTEWAVATGHRIKGAPWWVYRYRDGKQEYAPNASGDVRGFKTREAAQKVADKLQVTADFDAAREHARLATHHLIRATDGLKPGHPALDTLAKLSDLYLELTGQTL